MSGDRAAIYVRLAADDIHIDHPRLQFAACRAYCAAKGYEVTGEHVETGPRHDGLEARPIARRLMTEAVDVLVVMTQGHLANRPADFATASAALDAAGIRLEVVA